MALIETVAAVIISLFLYILLPPLLDGIERKIRAKIQARYGPPTVLQTWYDILKLASKELKIPFTLKYGAFLLILAFSLTIVTLYLLTYILVSFDIYILTLVIVLIISAHSLLVFMSTLSSNPFSIIGIFRGLAIDVVNEMGFIVSIPLYYLSVKTFDSSIKSFLLLSLSLLLALMVSYVGSKRLPYDLHEAEPELASGSIIEFSGPMLALYIYLHLIDRYAMVALPIAIGVSTGLSLLPYISLILTHIIAIFVYILFGAIAVLLGRSRIDIAVKTLMLIYSIIITVWIAVKLV
ncbi:MAG: NADH-quinone oxidoreductase subunit H [Ignisphaera sp.]|nr:NADH-quinone oxidoreductase subunit H [Ignisphaera sp.]MCX8168289.1 NADH-quinone oxidoreductase subunit H [Ignisphaera sp.]MDW8085891.1 NADH-quinone oxidoreductase subunit H [Ignisphaera sp.]